MPIKVLLADDSEVMRRSIRRLLTEYPEIELAGESTDFGETVRLVRELKPDLVVLDLHMPNPENLTVEQIKAACHGPEIIAISVFNDLETSALSRRLGASQLLDKIDLGALLVPAILRFKGGADSNEKIV